MLHPADILHTAETTYIKNNETLPAPHHQSARRGMCPHTRADPKYMCQHTAICVSSYYYMCVLRGLCPHTTAIHSYASSMRVRMLYRTSAYIRMHQGCASACYTVRPHTTVYIVHMYASGMCPHTAIYAIYDI